MAGEGSEAPGSQLMNINIREHVVAAGVRGRCWQTLTRGGHVELGFTTWVRSCSIHMRKQQRCNGGGGGGGGVYKPVSVNTNDFSVRPCVRVCVSVYMYLSCR